MATGRSCGQERTPSPPEATGSLRDVVRPLTRRSTGRWLAQGPPRQIPVDAPGSKKWLPAARRQRRREEDEDEENRDQEHRGGPRQDDGEAAEVDFHGPQTGCVGVVLRDS